MRVLFYNSLGMLCISVVVFFTVILQVARGSENVTSTALIAGGMLVLFDGICRLRLYRMEPSPQDKMLFSLSESGGGQLVCLPLWLWGVLVVAATLAQSPCCPCAPSQSVSRIRFTVSAARWWNRGRALLP